MSSLASSENLTIEVLELGLSLPVEVKYDTHIPEERDKQTVVIGEVDSAMIGLSVIAEGIPEESVLVGGSEFMGRITQEQLLRSMESVRMLFTTDPGINFTLDAYNNYNQLIQSNFETYKNLTHAGTFFSIVGGVAASLKGDGMTRRRFLQILSGSTLYALANRFGFQWLENNSRKKTGRENSSPFVEELLREVVSPHDLQIDLRNRAMIQNSRALARLQFSEEIRNAYYFAGDGHSESSNYAQMSAEDLSNDTRQWIREKLGKLSDISVRDNLKNDEKHTINVLGDMISYGFAPVMMRTNLDQEDKDLVSGADGDFNVLQLQDRQFQDAPNSMAVDFIDVLITMIKEQEDNNSSSSYLKDLLQRYISLHANNRQPVYSEDHSFGIDYPLKEKTEDTIINIDNSSLWIMMRNGFVTSVKHT